MEKENHAVYSFETDQDWRVPSKDKKKKKKHGRPSRGVSPERFYSQADHYQGSAQVNQLKETVESRMIREGKRRVSRQQTLRRDAYKKMTECKTWPLQEPALQHFSKLIHSYCHTKANKNKERNISTNLSSVPFDANSSSPTIVTGTQGLALDHPPTQRCWSASSCSGISSSDASSSFHDNDEPKRLLRTLHSSPSKNRYKELCRQEFQREHDIPMGVTLPLIPSPSTLTSKATETTTPSTQKNYTSNDNDDDSDYHYLQSRPALWSMEPCIWAWEISGTGKRKYVVGQLGRCLDWYWHKTLPENRHGYELIREGVPCRLYLDIEYSTRDNPHLSQPEASRDFLVALLESLRHQLQEIFPHQFQDTPLERRHIIDLDSSTEHKFSRHWIVHLPGQHLFSSNRAVGVFVHEWMGSLMQQHAAATAAQVQEHDHSGQESTRHTRLAPALLKYLMVNTKQSSGNQHHGASSPPTTCIVDLGVYTKNRLFRLLGSCKYGKPSSAGLRIAAENEFAGFPPNFSNDNFYKGVDQPKSAPVSSTTKTTTVKASAGIRSNNDTPELEPVSAYKTAIDWTPHADALAQTLVIPVHSTKIQFPILPDLQDTCGGGGGGLRSQGIARGLGSRRHTPQSSGPSPFPVLDDFVLKHLATRGGVKGTIRSWSLERRHTSEEPSSTIESSPLPVVQVTYFLSGNRYCEHVGRPHKSNGIFWVVDLITQKATQRCFDPDCRGFCSMPVSLPPPVQDHVRACNQRHSSSSCEQSESHDTSLSVALQSLTLQQQQQQQQQHAEDDMEEEEHESVATTITTVPPDPTEELSDEALVEAMLAHPELFP